MSKNKFSYGSDKLTPEIAIKIAEGEVPASIDDSQIDKINKSRENQIDEDFELTLKSDDNVVQNLTDRRIENKIIDLLNQISEEQRTAYILCEIDSKNYEEIAKITDVPIGTVRSRIFRARQFLMENLKNEL